MAQPLARDLGQESLGGLGTVRVVMNEDGSAPWGWKYACAAARPVRYCLLFWGNGFTITEEMAVIFRPTVNGRPQNHMPGDYLYIPAQGNQVLDS